MKLIIKKRLRKLDIALICCVINVILASAQETKSYHFSFSTDDFHVSTYKGGGSLIESKLHNTILLNDSTLPAIPYITARILIPMNSVVKSVRIKNNSARKLGKYILTNNPTEYMISSDNNSLNSNEIHSVVNYDRHLEYPLNAIDNYTTENLGLYRYVGITYTPFVYNASTQELSLNDNITLNIELDCNKKNENQYDVGMRDIVHSIIDNPEELDNLYPFHQGWITGTGYLIITSEALKEAFNDLSFSKALMGYNVKISTVEEIYANYQQYPDSIERIKRYIYDYYIHMSGNAKYVLLGGDDSVVPTRMCFCNVVINGQPLCTSNSVPSDLYYVCFDDNGNKAFDWDANGNGMFAEISRFESGGPEVDVDMANINPSLIIARLPVRTITHINDYLEKLHRYERDEFSIKNYYNRILLAGRMFHCYWNDSISDVRHWNDSIINILSINGYNANVSMLFDTPSTDSIGNFTTMKLKQALAKGNYNLINIDAHGIPNAFATGDGLFTSGYLNGNYQNAAIITTPACYVNNFTSEPSLGESFIRSKNTANVVFWGSADLGWGSSNPNLLGASNKLISDFYYALSFEDGLHIGDLFGGACTCITDRYKRSYGRWVALAQTLSGDPGLYINIRPPKRVEEFDIIIEEDIVNMENRTDSCKGYLLCSDLAQDDEGNMLDYMSLDAFDLSEVETSFMIYGSFLLGLYKDGYVPFRSDKDSFNHITIQNQRIKNYNLRANTVKIGSSISSDYDAGDVSIISGNNAIFNISGSFTITDGFECPLGAELEVITNM